MHPDSELNSEQRRRCRDALPEPRRIASEELLGRAHQIVILHNGREYRLRLTQNGKLILTA